jgi:phospholipase C
MIVALAVALQLAVGPARLIQHVVIVIQENRSVDNLFNGFPGADTVQFGKRHDGSIVRLHPVSLNDPVDVDHARRTFLNSYDAGKMDGFDTIGTLPKQTNGDYPYATVPRAETQPYWTLARSFTFADETFESVGGPSFPAHQYLISGESGTAVDNPNRTASKIFWWGCDSPKDATVALLGPRGMDGRRVFPCFTYPTRADVLDQHDISWRSYAPPSDDLGSIWSAFDAIKHIRYGSDWENNVITPETRVLTDIAKGSLPAVSWVTPDFRSSDHSQYGIGGRTLATRTDLGPQWVASIANALGHSNLWKTTALIVVWDDWGGWYDHVPPPQLDAMGLGFRVPMIIISPYAKRGYVSHHRHEFGSILKFTEKVFGLPEIGTTDRRSDDLSDCFDYSQKPGAYIAVRTSLTDSDLVAMPPSKIPPDSY